MAHKNWKHITSAMLLKLDPFYNNTCNNEFKGFVPSEKVFFKELYVEPSCANQSTNVDRAIRDAINSRSENLLLCIKGYAGCGKSVYVQRLLYEYFPTNDNFKRNTHDLKPRSKRATQSISSESLPSNMKFQSVHRLEIGAGTSDNDIISRYVDDLSAMLADSIIALPEIYVEFCKIVKSNDTALGCIDSSYKLRDDFAECDSIKNAVARSSEIEYIELKNAIRIELKAYSFPLLFAIDCIWRIAIYLNARRQKKYKKANSVYYICFDNLDAIDNIDHCNEFIEKLCQFRKNFNEFISILNDDNPTYAVKSFVFIITCRNVTWGKLHLSEFEEDDELGDTGNHLIDFDISGFYEYVDIVTARIKYFESKSSGNPQSSKVLNEMNLIQKLNRMMYVQHRFKPLFNYNYRKCIDVIVDLLKHYPQYIDTAIKLAYDPHNDDVYSGSSSVFFRAVFEYFKSHNLFGSSIMGLVDINKPFSPEDESHMMTSRARIILQYLYNESQTNDNGRTRFDQILQYFTPIYSASEIKTTIEHLFRRNAAWRRPINIIKLPFDKSRGIDALEQQLHLYEIGDVCDVNKFSRFAICKAGREYIEFMVAHFEFYASRISIDAEALPPLFCEVSHNKYYEENDEYQFEVTCREVKDAVRKCCQKLQAFNNLVMEKKKLNIHEYMNEPIIHRTKRNNPQLHEERIIFSHIYHLEAYRLYLINTYFVASDDEKRKDMNRRLIRIIKSYLNLYDEYIKSPARDHIVRTLRIKIRKIESLDYKDFETTVSAGLK